MARIKLQNIRHSYIPNPSAEEDYALKELNIDWDDGGAYALLGPSGCGKTTLLNIISGLLKPSEGKVLFNDLDVTTAPPDKRNIAQVFQFPVVYDTMTVFDNLAFPLRNRGVPENQIRQRVEIIAEMTDLSEMLFQRADRLTADGKQKISLGRGLVRNDVNVIMFDEPLTVIDPHLKWQLRSQLKELHTKTNTTMIYVTHDQTEALTFADRVVVMHDGRVVQIGTPVELFERPNHTFVGHFIGSPGMNTLPCSIHNSEVIFKGQKVQVKNKIDGVLSENKLEIGVRPEFVKFSNEGIPVKISKISDAGRYSIVEVLYEDCLIRLLVDERDDIPSESAFISFDNNQTWIYADGWIVE